MLRNRDFSAFAYSLDHPEVVGYLVVGKVLHSIKNKRFQNLICEIRIDLRCLLYPGQSADDIVGFSGEFATGFKVFCALLFNFFLFGDIDKCFK